MARTHTRRAKLNLNQRKKRTKNLPTHTFTYTPKKTQHTRRSLTQSQQILLTVCLPSYGSSALHRCYRWRLSLCQCYSNRIYGHPRRDYQSIIPVGNFDLAECIANTLQRTLFMSHQNWQKPDNKRSSVWKAAAPLRVYLNTSPATKFLL